MPMNGREGSDREGWREYTKAARRKIRIAQYHLGSLEEHEGAPGHYHEEVPIPIQASFEGILYATIAASDQIAEAINVGFGLGLPQPTLQTALEAMPKSHLRSRLLEWQQAPIAADVRDIRRRATHHHYVKAPGAPRLEVQQPTSVRPYDGSRTLVEYGRAAVNHAVQLIDMLEELEEALGSQQAPDTT
jgi:hypothetical protein